MIITVDDAPKGNNSNLKLSVKEISNGIFHVRDKHAGEELLISHSMDNKRRHSKRIRYRKLKYS